MLPFLLLRTDADAWMYMKHNILFPMQMQFSIWNLIIVVKSQLPETAQGNLVSDSGAITVPQAL